MEINCKIKNEGAIYTPKNIVDLMLDVMGYNSATTILKKHIMENSCGDGAFLTEIVKRYCQSFFQLSTDSMLLKNELEKYIHGIEKNNEEYNKCLKNLDKVASELGISKVSWDIQCDNSLITRKYDQKMDYIIGNPPYIRVHNLKENYFLVKNFSFAQSGMSDMYIVFFELSLRMLNEKGKLCFITPSSFLKSNSGAELRKYIREHQTLSKVIDLGHHQIFNATTYTIITLFDKESKNDTVKYKMYDENKYADLSYDSIFNNNKLSFDSVENLRFLSDIDECYQSHPDRQIVVKNGFATLADKIFIGDFHIQDELIIDIIKASTGKWSKCIFPYNNNGTPVTEHRMRENHPEIFSYLLDHKTALLNRATEPNKDWFLFGCSQGINDTFKYKISINSIIKDISSIKIHEVNEGQGVYSGLYIMSPYSLNEIQNALLCDDFIRYIGILKKYKSGGYYTFSSLELEKYLVYKLKGMSHDQCKIFASIN